MERNEYRYQITILAACSLWPLSFDEHHRIDSFLRATEVHVFHVRKSLQQILHSSW